MIAEIKACNLILIGRSHVRPCGMVHTESLRSYDALDVTGFSLCTVYHSTDFAIGRTHINGIENFWNQCKDPLRRYNGIPKQHFELFLNECRWWFN